MLYKKIEFNNFEEIRNQILTFFPSELNNTTSLFYVENNLEKFLGIELLHKELERLDLVDKVVSFGFYIIQPNSSSVIHTDHGDYTYSLNLPLIGCEKSLVVFYEAKKEPTLLRTVAGSMYYNYEHADCTIIDHLSLTQPCVMNIKVPHRVINTSKRLSFLIRLKELSTELKQYF